MAEHCRKMNDEAGALMYEERIKKKEAKKAAMLKKEAPVQKEETKSKEKK